MSNKLESTDKLECDGVVTIARGNGFFEVMVDDEEKTIVLCTISGKMKKNNIRILEGDRVSIEVSLYDRQNSGKGRITYRRKA